MVQDFWLQIVAGVCTAFFQAKIECGNFLAEQWSNTGKLFKLLCFSLGQIIAKDSTRDAWFEY